MSGQIKLVSILERQDGLTHEEFLERWNDHPEHVVDLPNLRRYERLIPVAPDDCEFDGISEIYFDSVEDCVEAMESDQGLAALEDATNFVVQPDSEAPIDDRRARLLASVFEVRTEYESPGE